MTPPPVTVATVWWFPIVIAIAETPEKDEERKSCPLVWERGTGLLRADLRVLVVGRVISD